MRNISGDSTVASGETINAVIDAAYRGRLSRRRFMKMLIAAGVADHVAEQRDCLLVMTGIAAGSGFAHGHMLIHKRVVR